MAKQLHRSFSFEPLFDALIGKGPDTPRELRFRNAGLDTLHFRDNVTRLADRHRRFVHPQIVEAVKSPGFHELLPRESEIHTALFCVRLRTYIRAACEVRP